jgi:hypothetical protein
MRAFLHSNRWASVLVAVLLLFATSGMAITRMTCLVGGHSVVSLGTMADCCPEDEPSDVPTVKAECCALSSAKAMAGPFMGHDDGGMAPLFAVLRNVPCETMVAVPMVLPRKPKSPAPPLRAQDRLSVLSIQRI